MKVESFTVDAACALRLDSSFTNRAMAAASVATDADVGV